MIALSKLESDGATADFLTRIIMSALLVNIGLDPTTIASKLLCFDADGVAAFQGHKNGVTKQIKDEFGNLHRMQTSNTVVLTSCS